MNAEDVAWLQTEAGVSATAQAATALGGGGSELSLLDRLRQAHSPQEARAAVALASARSLAARKFDDGARLYCDRESAQQASPQAVAEHTAARFAACEAMADLGCGMGGDTLALARHARVLAVDRDPARLAMVEANAAVRGLSDAIETRESKIESVELPPEIEALWLDPSRRDAGGRVLDPSRWSPPLDVALRLGGAVAGAGLKLAPGIDPTLLPEGAELEFVSLDGRLVEAVAWLGSLARVARSATVLPAGESLAGEPDGGATPLGEPGRYLYDPDPAVGRAGLIDVLAPRLQAWKLDERIAYLSGDRAVASPFARRFRVHRWLPFAERALLDALRALGASRVEVMRRASPVDTNALERRLNGRLSDDGGSGGTGDAVLTVALTRLAERHVAIICERERD